MVNEPGSKNLNVITAPANPQFEMQRGFYANYKLLKVPVTGGAAVTVCDCPLDFLGADWGENQTIVFGQGIGGIRQVAAAGGEPKVLGADSDKGEIYHGPQLLRNGEWVLFTPQAANRNWREAQIIAQSVKTGERRILMSGATDG